MGTPDKKLSEFVDKLRLWIPRRTESTKLSRDFWMPDQSCRVCYECDVQFTVFNRRHHCRICGRVFCAKCTANSIPVPCDELNSGGREVCDRVRVCSYCFTQWDQGVGGAAIKGTTDVEVSPGLSRSPSVMSFVSTKSSCTSDSSSGSTAGCTLYSTGPYQHVPHVSEDNRSLSFQMDLATAEKDKATSETNMECFVDANDTSFDHFGFSLNRRDDEDDDYGIHHPNPLSGHFFQDDNFYGKVTIKGMDHVCGPYQVQSRGDNIDSETKTASDYMNSRVVDEKKSLEEENAKGEESEPTVYDGQQPDVEPVEYDDNGLLWLPPEPEDKDDEREAVLLDEDDDDDNGGFTGEWGYLRPSNSLSSREYSSCDKSSEHRRAMKNAMEGHFRTLVSQLLQGENLPASEQEDQESWLNIVTSLSWEVATLLKPDTSKGGGMDPGGYVKVKCIASGSCNESMVVKGVVCKKNVAHRRMTTKLNKPRVLILGGALEYQRVSNHLSSFDTLLQQEKDHLKMAVAKIDAHHPNVLLVEKSVSRYAQEYLLEKNIKLVLNIKRPLLERIARCTGAQIVTSIDHLTSPKLGYCESFHVERFFEEHGSAGQGGKKLAKTLMYLDGCSKPLGCTILLKGARGDELKKVKHVVQYGVFAAYHMALETSFLADEGASFPDLHLKCPITLALPDKLPSTDRSISRVEINDTVKTLTSQSISEQSKYDMGLISDGESATDVDPIYKSESIDSTSSVNNPNTWNTLKETGASSVETTGSLSLGQGPLRSYHNGQLQEHAFAERNSVYQTAYTWDLTASTDYVAAEDDFGGNEVGTYNRSTSDLALAKDNSFSYNEDARLIKEEIPPLPLNSQGILVSVSKRCIWKGIVCEWAHRVRIKYYKSFDEPLGRFLRDQLFDQSYCCPSCDKPSEDHIYCYTHRQGSLTLSVKKLPDFLLPGERDNKIWMWHRCLRCPRTNSFPPATRRVVMSDAAWGLSFGRFLEMSFSSHAAASTVARCGHSLYRDCLRFYGLGRKVACFRYAYINVHSVYLPSAKLDFNYSTQVWIQKEANEISDRADSLFKEVETTLKGISDKAAGSGLEQTGIKAMRNQIMELENMLRKEKEEFKELFRKASKMGVKDGEPAIDILEINKLRRQILFHSYVWDQRLIYAVDSNNKSIREKLRSSPPKLKENFVDLTLPDKLVDIDDTQTPGIRLSSSDSVALENQPVSSINYERSDGHRDHTIRGGNSDLKASGSCLAFNVNFSDKCDLQESGSTVVKFSSEGQLHIVESFSDSVDATRTGEGNSASTMSKDHSLSSMPALGNSTIVDSIPLKLNLGSCAVDRGVHVPHPLSMTSPCKELENLESNASWRAMPFPDFYGSSSKKIILQPQKLNISDYSPIYLASFREREWLSGARLLLPVGVNETVIPVYDDEPTSIISYALVSADYHAQLSVLERGKDAENPSAPLPFHDSVNLNLSAASETYINFGSCDESILSSSGSRSSQSTDPLSFSTDLHARVSFTDDGPLGKSRYAVTCYYAKRFEALRRICCSSELDYIRSLSRCKKWGAQGGKSNVFFAKTLDDRFIIKQVTKTELESFLQFAPAYFKYLSGSFATGSPTCLAKILGIYQVSSKHLKGGKETKMDVLVMENLLFGRNISRLYDLKGSSRSRYNPDTSGSNKVLLDQNLIEAMPTSPIFVGNKAKRLLERAVWNDTSFLGAADVMDYSLLVGVDEERNELVVGIIDFIRQYTWDKHLESWVKTSGILGGPKNAPPTVISPQQYKKRFRKAMAAYFIMVLDQWSEPTVMPRGSDPCKETHRVGSST